MSVVSLPQFVYIVGMGHSGSTLLELLLNQYRPVAAMGELSLFSLQLFRNEDTRWVGKCSCGQRPDDCPVWGRVITSINSKFAVDLINSPFSWRVSDVGVEEEYGLYAPLKLLKYKLSRYFRSISYTSFPKFQFLFSHAASERIAHRDFLVTEYAKIFDKTILVDASKDPIEMRDISAFTKLPYKVIYLTRDARGLAWSRLRSQKQDVRKTAKTWVRLNGRILKLLETLPRSQWMHVAYEDICSNTESTLNGLAKFIGVNKEFLTRDTDAEVETHTIAGNRHRFTALQSVREDKAWEEKLTKDQISQVDIIAKPFLDRLSKYLS